MLKDIDAILAENPGTKAREIAKRLDLPRKHVSSTLHKHPDRYQQDYQFKWWIANKNNLVITLPNGWLTADKLERSLNRYGDLVDGDYHTISIVIGSECKAMIDCVARLLVLINQLAFLGKNITVDFTKSSKLKSYLNRSGFFDQLEDEVIVLPKRPSKSAAKKHFNNSNTLVEFGSIDPSSTNDDLINRLTNKFVEQSSKMYLTTALTVFGELIENVAKHSKTPLPGVAGLQKYGGKRNHIQMVVSDNGVGIADTLRPALKQHYPALHKKYGTKTIEKDIGLVSEAMSQGNISRFGGAHGLGFKSSKEQATKFNACFSVRQNRFCLKFRYKNGVLCEILKQKNLSNLPGTQICFDFYID